MCIVLVGCVIDLLSLVYKGGLKAVLRATFKIIDTGKYRPGMIETGLIDLNKP